MVWQGWTTPRLFAKRWKKEPAFRTDANYDEFKRQYFHEEVDEEVDEDKWLNLLFATKKVPQGDLAFRVFRDAPWMGDQVFFHFFPCMFMDGHRMRQDDDIQTHIDEFLRVVTERRVMNILECLCHYVPGRIVEMFIRRRGLQKSELVDRVMFYAARNLTNLKWFVDRGYGDDREELIMRIVRKTPHMQGEFIVENDDETENLDEELEYYEEQDFPAHHFDRMRKKWRKKRKSLKYRKNPPRDEDKIVFRGIEMTWSDFQDLEKATELVLRDFYKKDAESLAWIYEHIPRGFSYKWDIDLKTPLMIAFEKGALPLIDILMQNGEKLDKLEIHRLKQKFEFSYFHMNIPGLKKRFEEAQRSPYKVSSHAKMLHQHAQTLARIGADLQKLLK